MYIYICKCPSFPLYQIPFHQIYHLPNIFPLQKQKQKHKIYSKMQFLSLLFLALPAAFAAPAMVSVDASALDISSVPTCALAPAMAAFQEAGCQPMDVKCACSATLALAGLVVKVRRECSEADFQKAFDFAKGMCLEVGIDVPMTKPY